MKLGGINMAKKLVMPKLGLTMKEGKILKWYKKEGDTVEPGDKLYSLETDKLTNEVEATDSGVLRKIIIGEGVKAPCLASVAIIAGQDEDISALLADEPVREAEKAEAVVEEKPLERKKKKEKRVKISPVAKRLAVENNIEFGNIEGTGPGGRIVLEDVEKAIGEKDKIKVSPAAEKLASKLDIDITDIDADRRIMKEDILKLDKEKYYHILASPEDERIEMTTMRQIIAERMSESDQLAPTVNLVIPVNMGKIVELRNEIKDDIGITFTDILIKITSMLLLKHPILNSSIDGDEIILRNYVNMGVAVALKEGLLVPVIKNAHVKGLKEISTELKDLVYRAETNQLITDEIEGGTFTITNLGIFGIESFTPIINQPESAILGVNAIVDSPVVENGEVVVKPIMKLSLTADHRNVDGAVAALFLAELKKALENPLTTLL